MILGVFGFILIVYVLSEYDSEMNSHIGDKIVIKGDTLMIIDRSSWGDRYILDNGLEISPELIDNVECIAK